MLFLCFTGITQGNVVQISGTIKDEDSGKALDGATIEVFQDGRPFETKTCASNGKIPLIDLPIGHNYAIYIKKAGYVTKMVTINANFPHPEDLYPVIAQQLESSLFKTMEGIDFSFLETTPMIEFQILEETGQLGFDPVALKTMLQKIDKLKQQMEVQRQENLKKEKEEAIRTADFNAYMKAGNDAMTATKYDVAITQYEQALLLKPTDPTAIAQLALAKQKFAEKQKADGDQAAYSQKIEAGKVAFTAKKYPEALALYKEALALRPNDAFAISQITMIEAEIKKQNEAAEKFNTLVTQGDQALTTKMYDDAIAKYNEALVLKPGDPVVTAKLADAKKQKIDKEQTDLAAKDKEAKYLKLIQEADAAFDTKSFDVAKTKYNEALNVKPGEAHPTQRLKDIEAAILKKQQELDAANKVETDYKNAMAAGQTLFTQKNWEAAKAKYTEALTYKNNDAVALAQIAVINLELEKQAGETKKNAEYTVAMAEAKVLFDQKKYAEAKVKYYAASSLKPTEQAPKDQIILIDKLLADKEKQEQLEKDYQIFMTEGNSLKDIKDYTAAIDRYNKALVIKPGDVAATTKIAEINKILDEQKKVADQQKQFEELMAKADAAFNAKDYTAAKMNYQEAFKIKADPTITAKIKLIDEEIAKTQNVAQTQAKYDALMKEADAFEKAGNYEQALAKYREANVTKSTELVPQQKISLMEERIAAAKDQATKDQQFKDFVAAGDAAMTAKDYQKALASYQEALKIKPDPTISGKITTINGLIAQQGQTEQIDAKYKSKIGEADAAFTAKNWDLAKQLYNDAKSIKAGDPYPDKQIIEIEKQRKAEGDAEFEANYQKIIVKADGLKNEERFDEAIVQYQNALNLKSTDPYPKAQIDEINRIKTERANTQSSQQKLEQEYQALIKAADEAFYAQNYTLALAKYKEALIKKPNEPYPTSKISEINTKLTTQTEEQKKEEQYNNYISQANALFDQKKYLESIKIYQQAITVKPNDAYATNRIEEATRLEQAKSVDEVEIQYQKILTAAQKKFDEGDYTGALDLYKRALGIRPSDPLPQKRIDEINQILQNKTSNSEYDALIKQADTFYEKKEWVNAKTYYQKALDLKTDSWPIDQIAKIDKAMQDESVGQIEEQYQKIIKKADELFLTKEYEKSLGYYQRALGIKKSDTHAIARVDEIDRILHPEKYITASNDLTAPGTLVNTTENAIEALMVDAEQQREFIETEFVTEQREEAEDASAENAGVQTEENFDTETHANEMSIDIEDADWTSEVKRTESNLEVLEMEYALEDNHREQGTTNENDVQLQNQVVTNLNVEIEKRNEGDDLVREEYLNDVERIKIEVADETSSNSNASEEEMYVQTDVVNDIQVEHVSNNPNNDIDRINEQVYVEDMEVLLINENSQNSWDQEDDVMGTKDHTEVLVDERISNDVGNDIPREEGVDDLEKIKLENAQVERNNSNNQYDVTVDQKTYADNMSIQIEENNLGNDIPRQKMEVVVDNTEIEIEDNLKDNSADQIYKNGNTNENVSNFEIELEEDRIENDLNREDFVEDVVVIKDDINDHQSNMSQLNIDNGFDTEDYADGMTDAKLNFEMDANDKATTNADKTNVAVENIIEENRIIGAENTAAIETTVDYVDEIKNADPNPTNGAMPNEIGQKFPEGVTEEIYAVNDEDGLLAKYIVRRIVVKNGTGIVYEKVQTHYGGVTYSKDGVGISEYQWTDETGNVTLSRN